MTARRLALIVAVLLVLGAAGWAARPQPVTAPQRVERISAELRCPVCQGLSVQDSPSETAREMRDQVARRVGEGRSDEEIRAEFRRSYGDWVFLAPPLAGPSALVWLFPLLLVVGGTAVAIARVRRSRADPVGGDPVAVDQDAVRRLRELVAAEDTFKT
ncbi:MAG TPA: cytochrome c-type biogenesis protein [Candidatus Saccharimonadales bacterium]|nr:cytochrome c-type biogenesis protein [Candidatus Saccharimonadales bacterium]